MATLRTHTHSKVKSLQSQKPPERKGEGDLSNLTRLWEMVSWKGFGGWVNGFCEDTNHIMFGSLPMCTIASDWG